MELGTELGNMVSAFVGVHSRAEGTEDDRVLGSTKPAEGRKNLWSLWHLTARQRGPGQRIRHPLIPRPPVPSFSYLCCWQEASCMKSMAFYYDVGGLAAARVGVPFIRIGCFKTPAE